MYARGNYVEIMVSKFSNIMININKFIGNQSTFLSGSVTLCTQNVKYFCHPSVHQDGFKKTEIGKIIG
jgi:hypothetical protein